MASNPWDFMRSSEQVSRSCFEFKGSPKGLEFKLRQLHFVQVPQLFSSGFRNSKLPQCSDIWFWNHRTGITVCEEGWRLAPGALSHIPVSLEARLSGIHESFTGAKQPLRRKETSAIQSCGMSAENLWGACAVRKQFFQNSTRWCAFAGTQDMVKIIYLQGLWRMRMLELITVSAKHIALHKAAARFRGA